MDDPGSVPPVPPVPRLASRLKRLPLKLEIALAIAVKLSLLALLWKMFFSAPQAPHMKMPEAQVAQHLLNAGAPHTAPIPSPVKD